MKKINVFYFDSKGISDVYGVGAYRNILLPEIAKLRSINLIYVRFSYREKGGVKYNQEKKYGNYNKLEITFSLKDFKNYLSDELYTDKFRSRIAITIIRRVTGIKQGIFHLNSFSDSEFASLAKEAGYKVVATQHITFVNDYMLEELSEENKKILRQKEEIYLGHLTGMICLSEQSSRQLANICPSLYSEVIYNGMNVPKVDKKISKSSLHRKFGFKANDVIFLFAGRISKLKGLYELIAAFTSFSANKDNVKLIIAGGGNYDNAINKSQSAIGKIIFTGFLEREKLNELYRIADVGLLPSYSEQSSFSALEMMANKIPIIVSNAAGFEIYKDGLDVLKVKGDQTIMGELTSVHVESLEHTLNLLYKEKSVRKQMAKRSLLLISKKFSAKIMAASTINFYEKVNAI